MTIQEAIKSGREFKRPDHISWMWISEVDKNSILYMTDVGVMYWSAKKDDILADDWMIKEQGDE